MPEYYIRLSDQPEALGPMTEDQLKLLAQEGRISKETEHFYDDIVGWQPIAKNEALATALFTTTAPTPSEAIPGEDISKPRLSLKNRNSSEHNSATQPHTTKKASEADQEELSVEKMLQSAQGKTKETAHITKKTRLKNKTASLSLPTLIILHLTMGGLLLGQQYDALIKLINLPTWSGLMANPELILGAIILVLGILMILAVTEVYIIARYVAMMLAGYFLVDGYNYLYEGLIEGWGIIVAGLCYGIGVFWSSATLRLGQFITAAMIAVIGIASYGWVWWSLSKAASGQ